MNEESKERENPNRQEYRDGHDRIFAPKPHAGIKAAQAMGDMLIKANEQDLLIHIEKQAKQLVEITDRLTDPYKSPEQRLEEAVAMAKMYKGN